MNTNQVKLNLVALSIVSCLAANSAFAQQTAVDTKREEIVVFSREGNQQLNEAINQLQALYRQTKDRKVRDDLIALLIRQENYKGALSVCSGCRVAGFSESELENLGRAARNEKQFDYSYQLYKQLAKNFPRNPNGWLGAGLAATELKNYKEAERYLSNYKAKFGQDDGYKSARNYLLDKTEPEMAKLGRWQEQYKANPNNKELAIQLYRLAAKYSIYPLQKKIVGQHPDLFNKNDLLWLEHGESVNLSQGDSIKDTEVAYAQLTDVIERSDKESPIYQQALQDRLVIAEKRGEHKLAIRDYQLIEALNKEIPDYVQESYADALLAQGSPFKALKIYQSLERKQLENNKKVSNSLLFKLMGASSDAAYFPMAQAYLDQIQEEPFVNDYTHTQRVVNPNYDRLFYSKVNLTHWRGDRAKAADMLEERLTDKTPGDPWNMLALSDMLRSGYRYDDALTLSNKASAFLSTHAQKAYQVSIGNIALDRGDWRTATNVIKQFTEEERISEKGFIERYDLMRSARLEGSFGIQHKTSPKENTNNEIAQQYYLYAPKTEDGHDVYVHYLENNSPTTEKNLKQQRIGVGSNINLFPVKLNIETGKGIKLNDKYYLSAAANYALNQHWSFELSGNLNGSGTPLKAINQGVYTKDFGVSTTYTFNEKFQAGIGSNFMKFDDGNMRKSLVAWANVETYKHDRWAVNNNLRFDYQRNKNIDSAHYYNPSSSRNIELGIDISYFQPFDNKLGLTHHLRGAVGRYNQAHQASENSWMISYGHEWRVGKKLGISYEIGRKKNIYDGDAEFNNFGNVNFSIYF